MRLVKLPLYLVFAAAIGMAGCSTANITQQKPELVKIDETALMKNLNYLAADEFKGRLVGTPESVKAQEFLIAQLKEIGVKPYLEDYRQNFEMTRRGDTVNKIKASNIIGVIPGKKYSDQYIVLSAHYDHVGERNGEIYNGADDNASGTCGLIEMAKYFKKNAPQYNIIFAFFDAEESGLRGARHFVANLNVPKDKIILNVNMDMIGREDNKDLYACGTFQHPFLKTYIDPIIAVSPISIKYGYDDPAGGRDSNWTGASDHGAFKAADIPFIYFGVEDHTDYHKPGDEPHKIKQEFYAGAVKSILSFVKLLDKTYVK